MIQTSNIHMVDRLCPLCGSADTSSVFAEENFDFNLLDGFAFASRKMPEYMHYRMISCPVCDLLYASPVPPVETLAANYLEADFDSSVEAGCAARTYASFLPRIVRSLPDLKGALDIGTGDGAFLEQLIRCGFTDVIGVEPSKAPIKAAKEHIRPLIRNGMFKKEDFRLGHFSLVTCFQTLEHLSDPLKMCREACDMLKAGGALFVVSHNRRSLLSTLLGLKSPIFDIEHLQLLSPRSAINLMKEAGFEKIETRIVVNTYPLNYWLKLFPFPPGLKKYILRFFDTTRLGTMPIPFPVGNLAVIGFKPGGR